MAQGAGIGGRAPLREFGRFLTRRALIRGGLTAILGWCIGSMTTRAARAGEAGPCVDPDLLSVADASLRSAMEYVPLSDDPATRCSGCAFFTAEDEDARCGQCAILSGPVEGVGNCASFSPRE